MESKGYLCAAVVLVFCQLVVSSDRWGYTGKAGRDKWADMFEPCGGKKQSPININAEETLYSPDLKDFAIWYDPPKPDSIITVVNNGHTLQVNLEGDFFVSNGGLKHVYKAAQFHFHWGSNLFKGSEHLLESKPSPIEMHLVTYDSELYEKIGQAATETDGLAVLGTMFEVSKEDNPAFTSIIKAIKYVRDPHKELAIKLPVDSVSIRNILPRDISRYYRYQGSLTTPHCHESVIWTLFEQKQTISEAQLKEFRTLLQFGHHRHHKEHARAPAQDSTSDGNQDAVVTSGGAQDPAGPSFRSRRSLARGHHSQHNKHFREVLVELGIKGNREEEAYLKGASLASRERRVHDELGMVADQPADPGQNQLTKQDGHRDHKEAEMKHQQALVDNYRHVQPLWGRVVYRSFKLREPVAAVGSARSQEQRVSYTTVEGQGSGGAGGRDPPCDGASSLWASLVVLVASLLMTVLMRV